MRSKFPFIKAPFVVFVFWASNCLADSYTEIQNQLSKTSIRLEQAIAIAESHLKGTAYEAELEDDSFNVEYEVKLLADDHKYKVTVDGITGEVIRTRKRD